MELSKLISLVLLSFFSIFSVTFAKTDPSNYSIDPLHCVSEIYLVGGSSGIQRYLVNEFVDRKAGSTSMKMDNIYDGRTQIVYNNIHQNILMIYDVEQSKCRPGQVYSWTLAPLRRLVMQMLPIGSRTRDLADSALGPSALLKVLFENLNDFRYVTSEFSKSRLIDTNIYENVKSNLNTNLLDQDQSFILTVSVVKQSRDKSASKQPKTLAEAIILNKEKDILGITVCRVKNNLLQNRAKHLVFDCSIQELFIHVEYYSISKLTIGSLVGKSLDETSDYDFYRDPFMQPVGIGCWSNEPILNKFKVFKAPSLQFSAQYHTSHGSKEMTYIAYDGYNGLLRLDQDGKKGVYDLNNRRSYHSNEFYSSNSEISRLNEGCIVIGINDESLLVPLMLERLIGIGKTNSAYYLGSKKIDHVEYDVYETELTFDQLSLKNYNLPLLMEANQFIMPIVNVDSTKRFFMTYYLHGYHNALGIDDEDRDISANWKAQGEGIANRDILMVPEFIELWEYNLINGKKNIINRLEFGQFSWSLDVEPNDDPDSSDLSKIFNIESCVPDRAEQLEVRFRIKPRTELIGDKLVKNFQDNRQMIKEIFHENLAKLLDISRLNIIDLNIHPIQQSNILFVDSRIVQLPSGVSMDILLGYVKFSQITSDLKDSIIGIYYNRHSSDTCRIDSLAELEKNVMVFCEGLTVCILFKDSSIINYRTHLTELNSVLSEEVFSNDNQVSMCEVRQFRWSSKSIEDNNSILNRVRDNLFNLQGGEFEYRFTNKEKTEKIVYKGISLAPNAKSLDSIGSFDIDENPTTQASLGLKFTTMKEEPQARNFNIEIQLLNKENRFKYCQMACQLDEYCQSFSVCLSKKRDIQPGDCVLSTLTLNHERMFEISTLIAKKIDSTIEIKMSTSLAGQSYKLRKDFECNLHPKDYLTSYRISRHLNGTTFNKENEHLRTITSNSTTDVTSLISDDIIRPPVPKTIDDCASLNEENSVWNHRVDTSFKYCPMSSTCLISESSEAKHESEIPIVSEDEICYEYSKSHTKFYSPHQLTRLSIRINNSTHGLETKELEKFKLGRLIEGLNEEQCARDCNFRRSKCLAFDFCQLSSEKVPICVLYSFRSPIQFANMKTHDSLGLLPQEKQFFYSNDGDNINENKSSVNLIGSFDCVHFVLQETYFNIRLSQMLRSEADPQREELNQLEDSIIIEDEKKGDDNLSSILESIKKIAIDTSTSSGGIYFFPLIFGLIIGCLGALYASQVYIYLMDSWESFRMKRSQRHMEQRLSQLALPNSIDLDNTI